jgi:hypothetical protein
MFSIAEASAFIIVVHKRYRYRYRSVFVKFIKISIVLHYG